MKYVITWHEREDSSQGYDAAKNRLLEALKGFKVPNGCTIRECLVRRGEFGGYMIFETETAGPEDTLGRIPVFDRIDDHLRSHFQFKIEPVVDVTEAVAAFVTS